MYRRIYVGTVLLLAALFVGMPLALRAVQAAQGGARPVPSPVGEWAGFYQSHIGLFGDAGGQVVEQHARHFQGYLAVDAGSLFNAFNFNLAGVFTPDSGFHIVGKDRFFGAQLVTPGGFDFREEGAALVDGEFMVHVPGFGKPLRGVQSLLRDFVIPAGEAVPSVDGTWRGAFGAGTLLLDLEHVAAEGELPSAFGGTADVSYGDDEPLLFRVRGSVSTAGHILVIGQGAAGRLWLDVQATLNDQGVASSSAGTLTIENLDGVRDTGQVTLTHDFLDLD
jgi:hypothetical protein